MFENIVLGIIANFLTDFIKKLLSISPLMTSPLIGELPSEAEMLPPHSIQEKRRYNQERRDVAMAALAMALNLAILLGVATFLPLFFKGMDGTLLLMETRTPVPYAIGTLPLAFMLIVLFYLPSFYIVQRLTQYFVIYIHNEWSDVSRARTVRFFIGCCFVWLPIYAGALCYWLYPKLTIVESFGYPIGGVAAMFAYAWSSHR